MNHTIETVELRAGATTLTLHGGAVDDIDGLYVTEDGIEGWLSTPDLKVTSQERGIGDGAHDIPDGMIHYAARTITLHWAAVSENRDALQRLITSMGLLTGRQITIRVMDGEQDTYCTGYASVDVNAAWPDRVLTKNQLTIVCPRPERLAWQEQRLQLSAAHAGGGGGLSYGSGVKGLSYPLSYGDVAVDARNVGVLRNGGTYPAAPVFTVHGPMPDGVTLRMGSDAILAYGQPIGMVPLVLDCRSRTATIGGMDVSRGLTARGFPTVPAGGSVPVVLESPGGGVVDCLIRDTYM
ncbi:hypothetical protein [Bifidobacterium vansinderenii]|uniref:Phage tail protein n=1 Tax=Bifidobacterium vansinderenii TaxID=1984871 RepID=A0A229W1C3_9BIFI|nr:hypothetical protein [Bifidobacterium vansinderenii]OXN01661.1 hypothetical protein Tam10B_0103 [Bifidobacterium vansinderenii]